MAAGGTRHFRRGLTRACPSLEGLIHVCLSRGSLCRSAVNREVSKDSTEVTNSCLRRLQEESS